MIEQQKKIESQKREQNYRKTISGKVLPKRRRSLDPNRVYSFSQRAFMKDILTDILGKRENIDNQSDQLNKHIDDEEILHSPRDLSDDPTQRDWRDIF